MEIQKTPGVAAKDYLSFRVFCHFFLVRRVYDYFIILNKDCFVDVQHSKLAIKLLSRLSKDADMIRYLD